MMLMSMVGYLSLVSVGGGCAERDDSDFDRLAAAAHVDNLVLNTNNYFFIKCNNNLLHNDDFPKVFNIFSSN